MLSVARTAPPMTNRRRYFRGRSGSRLSATARLVRGPRATSVSSPGDSLASRTRASEACSGAIGRRDGGKWLSPRPSAPWDVASTRAPRSDRSHPRKTGVAVGATPSTSSTVQALATVRSRPTFPATTVIASTVVVAWAKASMMASASSTPGSVSMTRRFAAAARGGAALGRDRELIGEDVERRVHLEALHPLVVEGEGRAPERLHDRPVVLEDGLQLGHDLAALVHVEHALGLGQQAVEVLVPVLRLVPGHPRAVGEPEGHDAEGSVRPARQPERHLGPHLPELGRRQEVQLDPDARV